MKCWTRNITVNFEIGENSYSAEIEVAFHKEIYGSDADGNRGVPMTFIDEWSFGQLEKNGEAVVYESLPDAEKALVDNEIEHAVEEHDYDDDAPEYCRPADD